MPDDGAGIAAALLSAAAEAFHRVLQGTGPPLPAGAEPRRRVPVGLLVMGREDHMFISSFIRCKDTIYRQFDRVTGFVIMISLSA